MEIDIKWLKPFVLNLGRYFVFAGLAYLIFYYLFKDYFYKDRIQDYFGKRKDFIREVLYSLQTTLIISGFALLISFTPLKNYIHIYTNMSDYPLVWTPLSFILAIFIQDAYLYWTHRMMHHPRLFKSMHITHHKSIRPSPWTTLSFDFLEAFVQALLAPILIFIFPVHIYVITLTVILNIAYSTYAHLGYEIMPKSFRKTIFFRWFNTSVYHNMHHQKFNYNYGLYFRFWDKWMGTEHPKYEEKYDEIQERRFRDYKLN